MKRILLFGLSTVVLLSLAGCGQTAGSTTNAVNIDNGGHPQGTATKWVESFSVNQPNKYYVLTKTNVKNVGKLISPTNLATDGPGGWNSSDDLVEVYEIAGVDVSKAVAVKLTYGSYFGADYFATLSVSNGGKN